MNERIRELARTARGKITVLTTVDDEQWLQHEEFEQKFAVLIVKETMQVVANNLPQNTYLDVADAVIEHFAE